MTEHKIQESIEKFMNSHTEDIKEKLAEDGKLTPTVYMLGYKVKDDAVGMIVAPIMGEIRANEMFEKFISEHVLPNLFKEAEKLNIVPLCFSMSFEAMMASVKLDDEELVEKVLGIDNIKKVDGLVITFETKDSTFVKCFSIEKDGKSINGDGDLIDNMTFTPYGGTDVESKITEGGRYKNLFNKYQNGRE